MAMGCWRGRGVNGVSFQRRGILATVKSVVTAHRVPTTVYPVTRKGGAQWVFAVVAVMAAGCYAGVFKRLCARVCMPRFGVLLMHGRQRHSGFYVYTHTYTYNMYKTEFARIARESIVFSWLPPARLPPTSPHYLVSRISPSPGWWWANGCDGGGGGVLPFSIHTRVHIHMHTDKTDTIRQRSPMTSPRPPRHPYAQTLFWFGVLTPRPRSSPSRVNSKYSPARASNT